MKKKLLASLLAGVMLLSAGAVAASAAPLNEGLQKGELINAVDFGPDVPMVAPTGIFVQLADGGFPTTVRYSVSTIDGISTLIQESYPDARSPRRDAMIQIVPDDRVALTENTLVVVSFEFWSQFAYNPDNLEGNGHQPYFMLFGPGVTGVGGATMQPRLEMGSEWTRARTEVRDNDVDGPAVIQAETWHAVEMWVDTANRVYDLVVDGELIFTGGLFHGSGAPNNIGNFAFNKGENCGTLMLRNIAVHGVTEAVAAPAPTPAPPAPTPQPPTTPGAPAPAPAPSPQTNDNVSLTYAVVLGALLLTAVSAVVVVKKRSEA
jgi:hypothetical protein